MNKEQPKDLSKETSKEEPTQNLLDLEGDGQLVSDIDFLQQQEFSLEDNLLQMNSELTDQLNKAKFYGDQSRFNAVIYDGLQIILKKLSIIESKINGKSK